MRHHLLIVEDEAALTELLRYNLEQEGFRISAAEDGQKALAMVRAARPDLILLDLMLPRLPGLEVCLSLRRNYETHFVPIIMLTALGDEAARIRGLEAGADDYVTKPFSMRELIARIYAVLRRGPALLSDAMLSFDDIAMDVPAHRVMRGGRSINLGPTEFRLLRFLLENPRRVITREQLLEAIWGGEIQVELRTVDVHIARLRRALDADSPAGPIRTVRSVGYVLDDETA